jgi:hypothetical protein
MLPVDVIPNEYSTSEENSEDDNILAERDLTPLEIPPPRKSTAGATTKLTRVSIHSMTHSGKRPPAPGDRVASHDYNYVTRKTLGHTETFFG